MEDNKDLKLERQKYQLHKKGYEDMTKAIMLLVSELKEIKALLKKDSDKD